MKYLIDLIKGVVEYMKNLKKRIKELIDSGEDPELVRKLEEVLAEEAEEVEEVEDQPEEEVIAVPTEIGLPEEVFEGVRKIAAEKARLEAALGQYYMRFEAQVKSLVSEIETREQSRQGALLQILEEYSPSGEASNYEMVAVPASEQGPQKIILRRKEVEPEEE